MTSSIRDKDFHSESMDNLRRFGEQLGKYVPDPSDKRLLDPDADYTPIELQGFLQMYGSYIANLAALKRRMEAELLILKRSAKATKQMIMAKFRSGKGSVSAQEGEVMVSENGTRLLEDELSLIMQESCLTFLKGWLEAYEQAYASASRVVEVMKAEAQATGGNGRFQ